MKIFKPLIHIARCLSRKLYGLTGPTAGATLYHKRTFDCTIVGSGGNRLSVKFVSHTDKASPTNVSVMGLLLPAPSLLSWSL